MPPRHAPQKSFELLASHGVLQLANGFGFNLPHPLPRALEDAADLFQRVGVAVSQAVPQTNDLPLAVGERLEEMVDLFPQNAVARRLDRVVARGVFNELAEAAVVALADRAVEAHRVPADVHHPPHLVELDAR